VKRSEWPWQVAELGSRAGWCWSDLCSWALDRVSSTGRRDPNRRRLWHTARQSTCRADEDTRRTGGCYCGMVGPVDYDAEPADGDRDYAVLLLIFALLLTLGILAAAFIAAGVLGGDRTSTPRTYAAAQPSTLPTVPCRPILVDGEIGCRWASPDGFPFVAGPAPSWGAGAELVARQILDSRNGVTP
jgi:hypothetical protein